MLQLWVSLGLSTSQRNGVCSSRAYRHILFRHAGALAQGAPTSWGYTGFAYCLPMVGMKNFPSDQREPHPEGDIQVTK